MSIPDLDLTARLVGLPLPVLWTRYLGVGGSLSLPALVARVAGERAWPPREEHFLAVALNDALIDESLVGLDPFAGLQPTTDRRSDRPARSADLAALRLQSWNSRALAGLLRETAQQARRRAASPAVHPPNRPRPASAAHRWQVLDARRLDSLERRGAQITWRADARGRMLDSPSWWAFTGRSMADAAGRGWLDSVHPRDRRHAADNWQLCLTLDQPVRTHFRLWSVAAHNWQLTRVLAVPVHGPRGQTSEWVGTNEPIGGAPVSARRAV
jgi:hypothetical protein